MSNDAKDLSEEDVLTVGIGGCCACLYFECESTHYVEDMYCMLIYNCTFGAICIFGDFLGLYNCMCVVEVVSHLHQNRSLQP